MSRRSRARQVAFQVLYQDDLNPRSNPAAGDEMIKKRLRSAELDRFLREPCIRRAQPSKRNG